MVIHHCQTRLLLVGGAGALDIHRLTSICPIQKAGYSTVPVSFRFSAVANEPSSPAKQVTGSSHAAWVDISEGKITASNKSRDFVRIHAVILGFTAMNGVEKYVLYFALRAS
ncbi:hypothetical protein EHLJMEHL_04201 [Vreelandella titanicae]